MQGATIDPLLLQVNAVQRLLHMFISDAHCEKHFTALDASDTDFGEQFVALDAR